jgi:selenide,water dikinase
MDSGNIRLTALAHGGGRGRKLPPALLPELLAGLDPGPHRAALLAGASGQDHTALYKLSESQGLVATTDFSTPIVDDPFDFGRIAAASALSAIYAMGARPIMALAILGMPAGQIPPGAVREILAGGAAICALAGVPVSGGHSIDNPEPIYGLAAIGLVHPARILRNTNARPGDALILTKALGTGVLSVALRSARPNAENHAALSEILLGTAARLNTAGTTLSDLPGVHAVTDIGDGGLLGHALGLCRASGLRAHIRMNRVPLLEGAQTLAAAGAHPGAAHNWFSYSEDIVIAAVAPAWQRAVLCDPQTGGGLLIAVAPTRANYVLSHIRDSGFPTAAIIGDLHPRQPGIEVL